LGELRGIAMKRLKAGVVAVAMAVGLAAPAFACSPLAPPLPPAAPEGTSAADARALADAWKQAHWQRDGEQERARQLKEQTRLFDEAVSIALVRYDRADKVSGMPPEFAHMNGGALAILKPVRWLKGAGASDELSVGRGVAPPCGWTPANDALNGKPGDVFLIYLTADRGVMDGFRLDRIVEPRTLAALTAQ
jgi:hypothetical protein